MTCSPCQTTEIPDQQPDPQKFNTKQLMDFLESRLAEEQRVQENTTYNIPQLQKAIDALKAIA